MPRNRPDCCCLSLSPHCDVLLWKRGWIGVARRNFSMLRNVHVTLSPGLICTPALSFCVVFGLSLGEYVFGVAGWTQCGMNGGHRKRKGLLCVDNVHNALSGAGSYYWLFKKHYLIRSFKKYIKVMPKFWRLCWELGGLPSVISTAKSEYFKVFWKKDR